jgi:hypothetical protein
MKKHILLLIIICIYISGCRNKYEFVAEQLDTHSAVSISEDYKEMNGENVLLRYPLEFIIKKNSNIDFILLFVKLDNDLQSKFNDYRILDYRDAPIYNFEKSKLDKDLKFKIIFNHLTISKENLDNEQLSSFNKLQRGDSLIVYKKTSLLKDLNKKSDSLIVRAFSKDKLMSEKRMKIKW